MSAYFWNWRSLYQQSSLSSWLLSHSNYQCMLLNIPQYHVIEKRVFLKVYVLQWIAWWLHLHKLSIISKISVYLLQEMLADAPLWPEQPTARPSVPHATNQKWRRKQWEYIIYCKTIWTIVLHFDSNSLTISIPNGLSHTWRMAYQEGLNAFSKSWKNRTIWKLIIHNLI